MIVKLRVLTNFLIKFDNKQWPDCRIPASKCLILGFENLALKNWEFKNFLGLLIYGFQTLNFYKPNLGIYFL